jgi:hypothetical protein
MVLQARCVLRNGFGFVRLVIRQPHLCVLTGGDGTLDSHIDADTMGAQHSSGESQSKKSKND